MKSSNRTLVDRKILALLSENARQSMTAIAKRLGLARTTVHERIERLERADVIQGYTAIFGRDPDRHHVQSIVLLFIVQKAQERFMAKATGEPYYPRGAR